MIKVIYSENNKTIEASVDEINKQLKKLKTYRVMDLSIDKEIDSTFTTVYRCIAVLVKKEEV